MEFGLFIQGYNPAYRRAGDPAAAEHEVFSNELEAVAAADRAGFKYVWVTEHHFLDEYSHLSANDVICGYLAHATSRIHVGSGIFNPLPQVNHPVKVAERVAMLDHLSGGRFEFGTGRGAGSHEILGFLSHVEGISKEDMSKTREIWEETIGEFAKMWLEDTYEGFDGTYWSLPPRKVLPKPYVKPHPPMWYAAGNTSSYAMAARKGLGVLGFSIGDLAQAESALAAYKAEVPNAEPVGAFANDNLMTCIAAYVGEDGEKMLQQAAAARPNYLVSNVFRYHDTFPHPPEVPNWPEVIPDATVDDLRAMGEGGQLIIGDPDQALRQCQRWESIGVDQLVFGIGPAPQEVTLETIRLLGEHVIPKIDTDPEHRTSRLRAAAAG